METSIANKSIYIPRILDKKIAQYLEYFGALRITGPKWCGKTRTALAHSKQSFFLSQRKTRELLLSDFSFINPHSADECPILIDEWQIIPEIWDEVRINCDLKPNKGLYILTGSTSLKSLLQQQKIHHSGIGRIPKIKMNTMTLSETSDSLNRINLENLYNGNVQSEILQDSPSLKQIARWIIRGGWPENVNKPDPSILPNAYIESLKDETFAEYQNLKFEPTRLIQLLYSLARNESTIVSDRTLLKDISNTDELMHGPAITSAQTLARYKEIIEQLYLSDNTPPFSTNYRSSARLSASVKVRLTDVSLAATLLGLTEEKLLSDLNTMGLLFESLVVHDLKIYADQINANIYHFRDNNSGDEVDLIIEYPDGEYGAIEIKLSSNQLESAKKSLLKFNNYVQRKPRFMATIVGIGSAITKDQNNGIYTIPFNVIGPMEHTK